MGDVAFSLAVAIVLAFVYASGVHYGREDGIARATCYAAHLPYIETTSAGVVCGEPPQLLPILMEPKP